ncbi:hypothetical protein [Nocardia aurea]|uniref:hypothetical protein n=1 Tax=Nocardia aurea TaxID=2144174 RepID=UPI000D68FA02|nr:hypothetical protein [Nocardia aurea]
MSNQQAAPSPPILRQWVGVIGTVIAPTTVITALCYYFGYVYTRTKLAYFGIDCDALGFTSSDYVINSVSVLYVPLLLLLVGWFTAVRTADYTKHFIRSGRRPDLVRNIGRAVLALGAVLIATGIAGVVVPWITDDLTAISWIFTPTALGIGGLLVVGGCWSLSTSITEPGSHSATPTTRVTQTLAIAVSLLALFAVMNSFATRLGKDAAQALAHNLWTKETAISVVTTQQLDVPANLIAETLVPTQPGQPTTRRYECFRPLVARGDRWVLVPAKWSPDNGYALIIRTDTAIVGMSRSNSFKRIAEANPDPTHPNITWQCPERAPTP